MDFIRCNRLNIHYKFLKGNGDRTFLFINSLGTDFRIWDDVVESIKEQGNVLLFDKRGHGLSDASPESKGLEDFAEDVRLLLGHLAINKCIITGLSVGGIIAQLLAFHHPGLVEKLILCDTRHKIGNKELWNDRITQIKNKGLQSISEDLMKRWFAPHFHAAYPAKVAGCKNMLERCDAAGYVQTCEAIRDADTTEMAGQLKQPALCIVGSEDRSTTPEEVKSLSELIPDSVFKVMQGSGHIPCVDNPQLLSNLIIDFIKE